MHFYFLDAQVGRHNRHDEKIHQAQGKCFCEEEYNKVLFKDSPLALGEVEDEREGQGQEGQQLGTATEMGTDVLGIFENTVRVKSRVGVTTISKATKLPAQIFLIFWALRRWGEVNSSFFSASRQRNAVEMRTRRRKKRLQNEQMTIQLCITNSIYFQILKVIPLLCQ